MTKKERDAAYYQRNKERIKARTNAYYHETRADRRARQKERYEEKKEATLARNRAWADANRDKMNAYHRDYVKRNREKWTAQTAEYRAAKKRATVSWANMFFVREIYAAARKRKELLGGEWHVDHIVPLQSDLVCGLHAEANLCLLPGKANRRKSNSYWPDMP